MRTFVIGRSRYADIVLADASVARRHAELVVTDAGRFHLTDCASGAGTVQRVAGDDGRTTWQPLRQAFVGADVALRLGDHGCTIADLLRQVESEGGRDGGGRWRPGLGGGGGGERERLRGRVERDPVTGEIVRKRI